MHEEYTMHALSKVLQIPYATFYRAIKNLNEMIVVRTIGKSRVIGLNKGHVLLKSYLTISSEREKKEFLKNQPIIKNIAMGIKILDIVILFGSYAKGRERSSSDIDLMIINKKGERSISFDEYEMLFDKKINPIFVSKREFLQMLMDLEENVGKQVMKDHIILNNPEDFWGLVLNG